MKQAIATHHIFFMIGAISTLPIAA